MTYAPQVPGRVALVLAGGAARGAYEVGVLQYIVRDVARTIGRPIHFDVICGTSVGAINACAMAAYADDPVVGADLLEKEWTSLRLQRVVRPSPREFLAMVGDLLGRARSDPRPGDQRRGGLIDPRGIEEIVNTAIPFDRIARHLASGALAALTVSTTDVATGKTVIFVQRAEGGVPVWSRDPSILVKAAIIGPDHALASAAIPMIFPAVRIQDAFYCDGGLRQNVPLSPARRLGAEGLVVVNPRYIGGPKPIVAEENLKSYPGPLFLLGKALNALLLDRIDNDIDRLRRINAILEAGTRRWGATFVEDLNAELAEHSRVSPLQPLRVVHVRASEDIGAIAGEYVRSERFAETTSGVIARSLRRISEWEGEGESDLVSYVLFDGAFAGKLIELGRRDAKARDAELCAFFSRPTE
jgi:NTE family protein